MMRTFSVGGTIGLFTGLSLISLVEVAYWVYRTIVSFITKSLDGK